MDSRATGRTRAVWARVRRDHLVHRVLVGPRPVLAPNGSRLTRAAAYALLPVMASVRGNQRLIVRLCVVFALLLGLVLALLVLAWAVSAWLWQALGFAPGAGR